MLELRGVRHAYDGRTAVAVEEWTAGAGEEWLVSGPSGCGKTTLLHILAGLLRPAAGEARVAGQRLSALGGAALDRFRARHVGIVFQRLHLIGALTVWQNLLLAQSLAGFAPSSARAAEMLESLGIADRMNARPHALSHGQAQRAALARALINRPELLLADEPTSNLDDASAASAIELLRGAARDRGALLIVASHDSRLAAGFSRRLPLALPTRESRSGP